MRCSCVGPANKARGPAVQEGVRAYRSPMTTWRTHLEPFTRPLFFAWSRRSRGMTLGVRGVAVDGEGRVLLVKHTYLHGWWLPGGGVERGQTAEEALIREMAEEAGLIVDGRPDLLSVHSNERYFRGDHVLVYRIDRFRLTDRTAHGEIVDIGWFDPCALPDDTNRGTRDRLAEVFGSAPCNPAW
jgi:ADP-ribose pyrophosphatase YjhB (NUDIX family)